MLVKLIFENNILIQNILENVTHRITKFNLKINAIFFLYLSLKRLIKKRSVSKATLKSCLTL